MSRQINYLQTILRVYALCLFDSLVVETGVTANDHLEEIIQVLSK